MRTLALILGVALVGLLAYGLAVEPYWIEVRQVAVSDPFFGRALAGLKVVQVSDLHIAGLGRREAEVLRILDALEPDLLLLTGDYVRWGGDYGPALDFLARLKARLGVWGVLGEYDWSRSRQACLFCHEPGSGAFTQRHRVKFLRAEPAILQPGGIDVWISGPGGETEDDSAEPPPLRLDRPTILLAHNPLIFDKVEAVAPLFCLAGDTHGGQVRLPGVVWRALGYGKCARYREGLFRRGQATLYVSRGVGTSHLPLRLFERPEITVFRFVE